MLWLYLSPTPKLFQIGCGHTVLCQRARSNCYCSNRETFQSVSSQNGPPLTKMVERGLVKNILRATFFGILIIAYIFLYMEPALKQYLKRSKTIAQSREINDKPQEPPVLIVCPYPPFKASFFKDHGMGKSTGAEKYFWKLEIHWKMFQNSSQTAMDIYMNMSYKLGMDWHIHLFKYDG